LLLAPAAFDPDVAVAVVVPVAVFPPGVSVGRFYIVAGNPDVLVPIVAVIAVMPSPVGMFVGRGRNALDGAGWRADADDYLGLGDACGENECTGESGEDFFHLAISFGAENRTYFSAGKLVPEIAD
jgi:hypothetical protein